MLAIRTGEFSIGKLMVKNCIGAIFNQLLLQCLPCFFMLHFCLRLNCLFYTRCASDCLNYLTIDF